MTIETAPPMAHAVGGSLGSALALLLLYPLERARVELQTMTASASNTDSPAAEAHADNILSQDINNDKIKPLLPASRGGGGMVTEAPPKHDHHDKDTIPASVSEESWESCRHRPDSVGGITSSSSSDPEVAVAIPPSSKLSTDKEPHQTRQEKIGLWKCISILHQRGQLYSGVAPVVTTMAASNFVFFYMHSFVKQWLLEQLPHKSRQAPLRLSLLASTLAGICNVMLTNPLWVANLRIVTNDNNNNLWSEMKSIVESEGWSHLWNGTPASLLLVSNPVIQFVAYEQLKNRLLQSLRPQNKAILKPLEAFLLGALAKAISTVLTYPLQLAQTVLRVQKQEQQQLEQLGDVTDSNTPADTPSPPLPSSQPQQQQQYRGTLDCLITLYNRKGIQELFAGMQTKLLQTVLTAAFTFLTYEQIIRAIMAVHRALQEGRRVRHRAAAPVP